MNCEWKTAACFVAYSALESWLGITNKTKSGSVPELVIRALISVLMAAFNKLFKKGKENG